MIIAQFSGWTVCMVGTNRFFYLENAEPDPGEESVDQHEWNSERHPAGVTQGCLGRIQKIKGARWLTNVGR